MVAVVVRAISVLATTIFASALLVGCGGASGPETPTAKTVEIDGFTFEATNVDWDADQEALSINSFNGTPEHGNRFIFVTVTATRTSSGAPESLKWYELFAVATDGDDSFISKAFSSCVVTRQSWDRDRPMGPGDTERGVFCFEIGEHPVLPGAMSIKINHQIPGGGGVRAIVSEGG
jgi:hypothetical protein